MDTDANSNACNLRLYTKAEDLENTFNRFQIIEDEDLVARQQAADDLRIYGNRCQPSDIAEFDEDVSRISAPKQGPSESQDNVDHPAKIQRTNESRARDSEDVVTMDWNAGDSPLIAWLNQSTAAVTTLPVSEESLPVSGDEQLFEQEKQEIEVFKNVHVSTASKSTTCAQPLTGLDQDSEMEPGAQVFYRNILDPCNCKSISS